jgi:hypothetical protein
VDVWCAKDCRLTTEADGQRMHAAVHPFPLVQGAEGASNGGIVSQARLFEQASLWSAWCGNDRPGQARVPHSAGRAVLLARARIDVESGRRPV